MEIKAKIWLGEDRFCRFCRAIVVLLTKKRRNMDRPNGFAADLPYVRQAPRVVVKIFLEKFTDKCLPAMLLRVH